MSVPTRAALAVLGVAAVSCALVGAASSPAFAAPGNGKNALAGSVPSWAQAAHKVGASDKSTQVDFRVYLTNRGGDAAQGLAMAVSTPGNAQSGKFLTAAQYRAQFAPAQSDVDAVSAWLTSPGVRRRICPRQPQVRRGGRLRGPGGQCVRDVVLRLHRRRDDAALERHAAAGPEQPRVRRGGHRARRVRWRWSTTTPRPSRLPASGSASPAPRTGARRPSRTPPTPDGTSSRPRPARSHPCGYAGAQLQGTYGVSQAIASGNDGRGVTVAVIDAYASPTAART